jgi:formylglycine-generating enzyme required for sulfatase activity/tRNA A-37 threonylcarbamoyl transferase component Bud32
MTLAACDLLAALRRGELLPPEQLLEAERLAAALPSTDALMTALVERGFLTAYQAGELKEGRGLGLVVGSHVLLAKLGEGGMGEVFRARHKAMGREVALKRILAKRLDWPGAVGRFLREVRAAALLSHPNVVRVFDAGEEGGVYYLTMELLRGIDLSRHLRQRGPLPVEEAVEYVRQACVGMQHAHEKGLVHRDLKPANLMLTDKGLVKVLDMGLALVCDASTMTQAGGYFGTVDYMAPEQVQDSHQVDIRADVYSLGCALYHLLAGKTPFADTHPAARPAMHLSQEPPPIEQCRPCVPPRVAAVVRKMMAKDRQQRHQTPGEAAEALAALLRRDGVSEPASGAKGGPETSPSLAVTETASGESIVPPTRTVSLPPLISAARRPGRPAGNRAVLLAGLIGVALTLSLGCLAFLVVPVLSRGDKDGERQAGKDKSLKDKDKAPADKDKAPREEIGKDKDTFSNSVGMKFVRVKAGTFMMGSPKDEKDRGGDELQHEVELTKDFFIGVTEVTQKQYRAVMGYHPSHFSADGKASDKGKYEYAQPGGGVDKLKGKDTDDFPAELVSWEDAQDFLKKLNALEKKYKVKYRLPSEAEWEYACRGGPVFEDKKDNQELPFHFEKPTASLGHGQANFYSKIPYGDGKAGDLLERTNTVGKNGEANPLGLVDMHGNVREWCEDRYGVDYYKDAKARRDPTGPEEGISRVLRGGGWSQFGRDCRAAFRGWNAPGYRNDSAGFRVVAGPSSE